MTSEGGASAPGGTARARRNVKSTLIVVAGALAIVAAVAGGYYFAMRPVTLRIAVGPPNSDDVKVIQALAQAFMRDRSPVRLRPIITEGAAASASAIGEKMTDLAVIRGDLDLPKDALAVATLRKNFVVLWVVDQPKTPKNKRISKIEQLAGKRVGVIGRTGANINLLKTILNQYGVPPDKVATVQFSTANISEIIKNEKFDAYLAVGPLNSKITADAIAATSHGGGKPAFLAIDAADAIAQRNPIYEAGEIPAGNFGAAPAQPEDAVKTISFNHHIVARKSLSDTTVAALTRQLFAVRQTVLNEFPQSAKLETPDTDKDAAISVHPGAAAYIDGEEKSFLDRYSDYIWWALMGLSGFGSIGAWFASYLRRDERTGSTSLRDRLLDMIGAARKCDSIDELDALQAEADGILRETLEAFEHGAIEEGALTAFSIALEQFHSAVADRKAVLAMTPPLSPRQGLQVRM